MRGWRYSSARTGTASECPGLWLISGWWRTVLVLNYDNHHDHISCLQTLAMVTGTGAQRSWSSIFPWGLTTRGGGQLTSQETCFRWWSHLKPLKRKFKPKIQFFRTGRNTLVAWLSQCGSQAPGRAWRWWRSSPCSTAGTRTATTSSVSLQSTRSLMWGIQLTLSTS